MAIIAGIRPGGGYDDYELVVDEGGRTVHNPPRAEPTVTLKLKPLDFLKLVTGNAEGRRLFLRGKLKVDGDLMAAARLTDLFAIPGAR